MRFKRIFSALCIALLLVIQCVPVYAANYIYKNSNKHYFYNSDGVEFFIRGYQRTPSKSEIPLYLMETNTSLWLISDCGHSDWYISGFGGSHGSWGSYFSEDTPVNISGNYYGFEIEKGSSWFDFTNWGVEEVYNKGITHTEAGENSQLLYYTEETLGSEGADFFHYTPIIYRQLVAQVPAILPGTQRTALLLAGCGVCSMALLIGLSLFGKLFKIFRF